MQERAVELRNVETIYEGEHLPAIKSVNLLVEPNEFLVVMGPNGSGKTTLLETINGLLKVTYGKVLVFGYDMAYKPSRVRRDIGYVPQDFISEPSAPFIVKDIVLMGRYGKLGVLRRPGRRDLEIAWEAMRLIGIEEFAERPIGKLSGGEQQKVMTARAIAQERKLLLLDEPFSNLDVDSRRKISDTLSKLHDEGELTTIMVTHDLSIPERCDRVIIMDRGRIILDGEPKDVIQRAESLHILIKGLNI
ncbi:TPA: metal ABC transporter ATP-binding protein [Candidatus Bathyarchaeota archaeon]|nr:metal ABC transporter ATP-binding protein [Candidatus Bathyarchaeota archaeon]